MSQETEISWHVLRRIVQEWAGTAAELAEVKPLDGGCINTTLALTLADGTQAVLKISVHRVDHSYEREAHQLGLLRQCGLPTPTVYAAKVGTLDEPYSYILMQFIDGVDWGNARHIASSEAFNGLQTQLAQMLLTLHATTGEHYCRSEQGETPCFAQWPAFYRSVYDPMWEEVVQSPLLGVKTRKQLHKIHEKLDRLLAHDDIPRLVHWDIWDTNLLARADEAGNWNIAAFLDPNCKFAHYEAELAYMELFSTVGPAFMKAYQRNRRLPDEYHRFRKPIYQLYSLINHVYLFGERYVKPMQAALDRVMSVA